MTQAENAVRAHQADGLAGFERVAIKEFGSRKSRTYDGEGGYTDVFEFPDGSRARKVVAPEPPGFDGTAEAWEARMAVEIG
tara:strand:+ start:6068 stop:6310 length:243 start_codon:yes stop_codon:yes gene_type:complete